MSDDVALKKKLIRLAHENPEARADILALLRGKEARMPMMDPQTALDFGLAELLSSVQQAQRKHNSGNDEQAYKDLLGAQRALQQMMTSIERHEWGGARPFMASKKAMVQLPSEEPGGKPSYDEDFKAGFMAGQAARAKNDMISRANAERAYRRVGNRYGLWWIEGFSAAIDLANGAYATRMAMIAKRLGLA